MFSKVKSAVSTLVGGILPNSHHHHHQPQEELHGPSSGRDGLPPRYPYSRPDFLDLSAEMMQYSADHTTRAIVTAAEERRLPWNAGYAEVVNAGKSMFNEDQASCEIVFVERRNATDVAEKDEECAECPGVSFHYWALFDGHAGPGAAIMASKLLHFHICDHLRDIVDLLLNPSVTPSICLHGDTKPEECHGCEAQEEDIDHSCSPTTRFHMEKAVSLESLVIGAIENAYKQMDEQIERERTSYSIAGGCCALAVLCLNNKLYVANAGDSRAIIVRHNEIIPVSSEFTPETERQRLQYLGFLKPELLGNEFTHIEFPRRIQHKEVGKKMLYRDHTMTGWAYKTIQEDDLKFPLIYGEGKKARVMATIGVTRGLGDHDLKVYSSNIYIKPFLSCYPEVKVYDLSQYEHGPDDVLIIGTDGLWDVTTNREVADTITAFLSQQEYNNSYRYTLAAQELVMKSRGVLKERGWRLANDKLASGDDITAFVIPLDWQNRKT
uniref:Protein phosphatase, Mg2+/Mn2+ dependent, 1J n=1 Tax=Erpetoichthys calabaricus TaxID=27687 RepID=A0A8C4XBW8_ERPCA